MLKLKSLIVLAALATAGIMQPSLEAQVQGSSEALEIRNYGGTRASRLFETNHGKYLVSAYFEEDSLDFPTDARYINMVIYAEKGGSDKPRTVRFRPGYQSSGIYTNPFELQPRHDQKSLYINKVGFHPPANYCKGGAGEFYKRNPRARLIISYLTPMQ